MTSWLLDTNVVSELRRPKPDKFVLAFLMSQAVVSLHVSAVTLAELRYGVACQADPLHRAQLERWLAEDVRPMFDGRIMAVTEEVMLMWRVLVARARQQRYTCPQPDLLIAATAAHHKMTVVKRNTKDFDRHGISILDPWTYRQP